MKNVLILIMAFFSINCSPKLSPDTGWNRQRWVVVEMKGVPVQQSGSRRDAYINFEVADKKIAGNGGCNQITGNYMLDKSSIHFTDITSTKMSCNDIEFENVFISILGSIDRYEVRGADLLLKRKREVMLVLRAN